MQSSTQSDFGGDAWAVAKLYDRKVQQKIDNKMYSWVQLAEMSHGASMPHELIAATQELSKKLRVPKKVENGDGKWNTGKDTSKNESKGKHTRKCPRVSVSGRWRMTQTSA